MVTITSTNPTVPKEVGKVGTESPAFIQPITERKDGIRAMFAKQQRRSPSPSKPSAPTLEQAQPNPQPQSESQSPEKMQVSSEFPTTPVGKRKASALEDSGVQKSQGSPTKKPRLGSTSPRKGGPSPTVSVPLSHATLTPLLTVARNRRVDKHRALQISSQRKRFHSCPALIMHSSARIYSCALFRSHLSLASSSNVTVIFLSQCTYISQLPNLL